MTTDSKWPAALLIVIGLLVLRGALGLFSMAALFHYVLRGQYPVFGIFYLYLSETLLFIIIGLWLFRRSEAARIAAIALCAFAMVWSSYGFLSRQFHQVNTAKNAAFFSLYLAMDFFTIAYLSRPSVKALFARVPPTPDPLSPRV